MTDFRNRFEALDSADREFVLRRGASAIAGRTVSADAWSARIESDEAVLAQDGARPKSLAVGVGASFAEIRVPLDRALEAGLAILERENRRADLLAEQAELRSALDAAGAWRLDALRSSLRSLIAADPVDLEAEGVDRVECRLDLEAKIAKIETECGPIRRRLAEIDADLAEIEQDAAA